MNYYECHITFGSPSIDGWEARVKALGWKFSVIAGDPLMGPGERMYATTHFNQRHTLDSVWLKTQAARKSLEEAGASVLRCKVEGILKDERYV